MSGLRDEKEFDLSSDVTLLVKEFSLRLLLGLFFVRVPRPLVPMGLSSAIKHKNMSQGNKYKILNSYKFQLHLTLIKKNQNIHKLEKKIQQIKYEITQMQKMANGHIEISEGASSCPGN